MPGATRGCAAWTPGKPHVIQAEATNLTHAAGKHDLPAPACSTEVSPGHIALSGHPSQYRKTPLAAVGFWEHDEKSDGYEGLYSAICYDREDLLERHRSRYEGVRSPFTPDCSQFSVT
ncbi:hypothetical protein [Olsenella sp. HMSC062G07]|uniref:hypothetical protein n=1 Tax=Olsenella sp. HMSC062G07 TaxID=1739330 RepID=UPI0008A50CB8|nr:hypothetical protein [Olsenella sp. HMSC062G07]OFK23157.1 hypothetical protein HMPREF2826_00555 [Olsenella sp. HMSC062G07]